MGKRRRQIFFYISVIFMCVLAFSLMTFFAVNNRTAPVTLPKTDVPAAESTAKRAGIIINLPVGGVYLNFDYTKKQTDVAFLDEGENFDELRHRGYSAEYSISADYDFILGFIDRLGGIELISTDNISLRYTGVQVVERLKTSADVEYKQQVTEKIFAKIAEKGFSKTDLAFVLENVETQLSYPQGYAMRQLISTAANKVNFLY